MAEEKEEVKKHHPADTNGDGRVSDEEHRLYLEFKRKELEDADARRCNASYDMVCIVRYVVLSIRNFNHFNVRV